jgi:hypothetical protein
MTTPETFVGQAVACLVSGYGTAGLVLLAVLIGELWRHSWAWIDDSEPGRNPVLDRLAKLRGWAPEEGGRWIDKKGDRKYGALFLPCTIAFASPLSIFLGIKLYPFLLAAICLFLIAYVARFARRHKKLFDKHLKDPKAHQ